MLESLDVYVDNQIYGSAKILTITETSVVKHATHLLQMKDGDLPYTLPFCLVPSSSLLSFARRLLPDDAAKSVPNLTFLPTGPDCMTLPWLDGHPVIITNEQFLDLTHLDHPSLKMEEGKLMQARYVGPMIRHDTKDDNCIFNLDTPTISPANRVCNDPLRSWCPAHPNSLPCLMWLEKSQDRNDFEAFSTYKNICSNNRDLYACDVFAQVVRSYENSPYPIFADLSLQQYCSTTQDSRCDCYHKHTGKLLAKQSPDSNLQGPFICWDSSCQVSDKWLTQEMIDRRKDCRVLNCDIEINNINLGNKSFISVENSCVNGTVYTSRSEHVSSWTEDIFQDFHRASLNMLTSWSLFCFVLVIFVFITVVFKLFQKRNRIVLARKEETTTCS